MASPPLSRMSFFSMTFLSEPATVIPWRTLSRRVSSQTWFPSDSSRTSPVLNPWIVPFVTSTPVRCAMRTPAPEPAPVTAYPPRSRVTLSAPMIRASPGHGPMSPSSVVSVVMTLPHVTWAADTGAAVAARMPETATAKAIAADRRRTGLRLPMSLPLTSLRFRPILTRTMAEPRPKVKAALGPLGGAV